MRINRLFEIVYLLLDQKTITAKSLAERFEVSQRTIYRDIEILSSAGIPIYMSKGKGGGISLLPDYVLNKTVLTEEEKLGILSSLRAMNSLRPEKTDTALNKLSSMLGEHNTDWIEVDFSNWSNSEYEKEVFEMLKEAILAHYKIRFSYASSKREETKRVVLPLKLCFKGQAWYLYGFCTIRNDYRFFKLSRIRDLATIEETFECHVPKSVLEVNTYKPNKMIQIKMIIGKELAFRVFDEFEQYTTLENGDFLCEMTLPDELWVPDYIGSFGEYGELLEPASLRNAVKERLEKSLKKYL